MADTIAEAKVPTLETSTPTLLLDDQVKNVEVKLQNKEGSLHLTEAYIALVRPVVPYLQFSSIYKTYASLADKPLEQRRFLRSAIAEGAFATTRPGGFPLSPDEQRQYTNYVHYNHQIVKLLKANGWSPDRSDLLRIFKEVEGVTIDTQADLIKTTIPSELCNSHPEMYKVFTEYLSLPSWQDRWGSQEEMRDAWKVEIENLLGWVPALKDVMEENAIRGNKREAVLGRVELLLKQNQYNIKLFDSLSKIKEKINEQNYIFRFPDQPDASSNKLEAVKAIKAQVLALLELFPPVAKNEVAA